MADSFTEVQRKGFFSRIINSVVGVLFGILCLPASVALLSWNEYRTIHRSRGLAEAEKVVVPLSDPKQLDETHNGKLVHFSGRAETTDELTDEQFGIQRVALRLNREVEMFQWTEKKRTETRNKTGGGTETKTTYDYYREWAPDRVSSESFHHRTGHENPPLKYHSKSTNASNVHVGVHRLGDSLIDRIQSWEVLPPNVEAANESNPSIQREHFTADEQHLYYSSFRPNPQSPVIGDIRVRFRYVPPTQVSILSKQQGELLSPYETSNGESIERLSVGTVGPVEMFNELKLENSVFAYLLRFAGWFLASLGFGLIARPLSTLASIIPFLGNLTGSITFFVSVMLGAVLSLLVIAFAWIAVRPLWAGCLIAIAIAGLWFLRRKKKGQLEVAHDGVLLLPK